MSYKNPATSNFRNNTGDTTYKSGNTIDVNSKQATPIVYPTQHPENFAGSNNVMISKDTTLDNVIDSSSLGVTSGYVKDSDLIDGTINARFNTLTANEYHITILSSSVLYANGSNKFGDSADDRHEFTGSILIGGDVLGNARLNQASRSLELHSGSMVGITNGLMALTASMKAAAIVSSSTQVQNYDVFALNSNLYTSTGSLSSSLHDSSKNVTFNTVAATSNGLGQNFKVGDDVWLGDINVSNVMQVKGVQDATKGFIQFGSGSAMPKIGGNGANHLNISNIPTYAHNAAALAGGLVAGDIYLYTGSDFLAIVH